MSAAPSVRILASVLISSSPSETACFRAVDEPSHQVLSQARVLDPVGLDKALVNAPAGMDRSVALVGEQGLKVPGLGIGEQVGAGVQRVPGPVEPVSCPAPAPCGLPTGCGGTGRACRQARETTWNGVHDRPGLGELLSGGALEPWAVCFQASSRAVSQFLRAFLDRLGTISSRRAGPLRSCTGAKSMTTAGVPVAPPGVTPDRGGTSRTGAKRGGNHQPRAPPPLLNRSNASLRTCSVRVRIALLAACQESPSACASRETDMDSRPRARSPPLDCRAGQTAPGLSQAARVLSPHSAAVSAGEASHAHHQLRGPPPHRHVDQAPGHRRILTLHAMMHNSPLHAPQPATKLPAAARHTT